MNKRTEAGVSAATVSRALRNHPELPSSTCRRVQQLARDLGYTESPMLAEAMRQVRARRAPALEVMEFLTGDTTGDGWQEAGTYRLYYEGARDRAAAFGFDLQPFWAREPGLTRERLTRMLRTRAIRGVIVAPLPEPRGELPLDRSPFASAALGHSLANPDLNRTVNHQYHAVRLAIREIARRGYTRIGLAVSSWFDTRADHNWTAGYLVWQEQRPIRSRISIYSASSWSEPSFAAWFRKHRPEVVISSGGLLLEWLRRMGLRVPRDVGYANLDLMSSDTLMAGIDQNSRQIGAAAVDLVLEQLVRGTRGVPAIHKTVLVEEEWRDESTLNTFSRNKR